MMKKLKFDPVIAILIAVILLIVIAAFSKNLKAQSISKKIDELKNQIDQDLIQLNLATQTQERLKNKAQVMFKLLSMSVIFLFVLINILLVAMGVSFVDSLEGTSLVAGLVASVSSLVVFNRIRVNDLLELAQKKVMTYLFKQNGFEPSTITLLQSKISINRSEIEKLKIVEI